MALQIGDLVLDRLVVWGIGSIAQFRRGKGRQGPGQKAFDECWTGWRHAVEGLLGYVGSGNPFKDAFFEGRSDDIMCFRLSL
jgi:hypothetical protein